ncbi:hypothetical protein RvY_17702 [Ramazzottius varieornatus]|uniref:Uncharacterized protein n=1 Tax=Ramazzottius varieornatus TaxID=947166 RepID=A0A1D1W8U2_RAMVA|nr:hypothetical protein RvY_17702 [Ramazzottius varieornatus]
MVREAEKCDLRVGRDPESTMTSINILHPRSFEKMSPEMRTDELVQQLRETVSKLRSVDSGDSQKEVSKKLAVHLAQDGFLQHADKLVRALTAVCLAEMFRIFVGTGDDEMASQGIPTQMGPLSDLNLLKAVFTFFVDQLQELLDRRNPLYTWGFHVAQVMASTKAFTLIFSLDDHQSMMESLVDMILNVVGTKHTPSDRMVFLDILVTVIGDTDAVISHPLLKILLHPLTREGQRQNQAAFELAKDLLKRVPREIEPCISSYFVHLMVFESSEPDESPTDVYEIILELFEVSPQLVSSALKHLEHQVGSTVVKERMECLILIGKLFVSEKFPEVPIAEKDLLVGFAIKRLTDIDEKIRIEAVKIGKDFICTRRTDEDPKKVSLYVDNLEDRLLDPYAHVRVEAIKACTAICETALDFVEPSLVDVLTDRLLDKDQIVREACVNSLCALLNRLLHDPSSVPSTAEKIRPKLGSLLPRLLNVITSLPERTAVEYKFLSKLLPASANEQTLANHLVYYYACCDQKGLRFFEDVLGRNMRIRSQVLAAMREDPESVANRPAAVKAIQGLAPELNNGQRALDQCITKFAEDAQLRTMLINFASFGSQNYGTAMDEMLKRFGNPTATNHVYQVAKRLCEVVVPLRLTSKQCRVVYGTVLDILDDHITETDFLCPAVAVPITPEVLRERASGLLQLIAEHIPIAFSTSVNLERIFKFWRDRDDQVANNVYRFFAYCIEEVRYNNQNRRIVNSLLDKAQEFASADSRTTTTYSEAKYAVRIISRGSSDRLTTFRHLLTWAKMILTKGDADDVRRISAVTVIGELAVCASQALAETADKETTSEEGGSSQSLSQRPKDPPEAMQSFAKDLMLTVENTVLPSLRLQNLDRDRNSEADGEEWVEKTELPFSVLYFIQALRATGRCIRSYHNIVAKEAAAFLPVLRKFVNKIKEVLQELNKVADQLDEVSQEYLSLYAAKEMIKTLPKFSTYEAPNDLSILLAVMPKFSHQEAMKKYLRCLYSAITEENDPGRLIAAVSSAALVSDLESYRDLVTSPLVDVMKRLRRFVIGHAERYRAKLPERGLLYLVHWLAMSKDFKDAENLVEAGAWLEKVGTTIYCLLDAYVTENAQFSPGIINVLLKAAKSSHVAGHAKNKKIDRKLYVLCDFTSALLEKRFPGSAKQESPIPAVLPSDILIQDEGDVATDNKENVNYFTPSLTVIRKGDGTVSLHIGSGSHDRSLSRDSDSVRSAKKARESESGKSTKKRDSASAKSAKKSNKSTTRRTTGNVEKAESEKNNGVEEDEPMDEL